MVVKNIIKQLNLFIYLNTPPIDLDNISYWCRNNPYIHISINFIDSVWITDIYNNFLWPYILKTKDFLLLLWTVSRHMLYIYIYISLYGVILTYVLNIVWHLFQRYLHSNNNLDLTTFDPQFLNPYIHIYIFKTFQYFHF